MSKFEYPGSKDRNEEKERKLPEFIYMEEEHEWQQEEPSEQIKGDFFQSAQAMQKVTYPLTLRVFCVVAAGFMFIATAVVLALVALFAAINLVTFFQLHDAWERTKQLWANAKKMLVISCGLLVCAFNPSFGFAIIMVYFLLLGQNMDEQWATRILKSKFYRP